MPSFVEEAVKRRKDQTLSQTKLAVLAGVSDQTVDAFERQRTSFTLESAENPPTQGTA